MRLEWFIGHTSRLPFSLLLSLRSQISDRFVISALTVVAVAASVSLSMSVEIASRALQEGLRSTARALSGATDLSISAGEVGVPEEVLEQVREIPGVLAASPLIRRTFKIASGGAAGRPLHVVGLDLLVENDVRVYELSRSQVSVRDVLRLLALPNSIVITERLAAELGLVEGASLSLASAGRRVELTVRGTLGGDLADAYGGQIAGMDIYALQSILGVQGRFDQIDVAADPGAQVDELSTRIAALVGPTMSISRDAEGETFGLALLRTYQRALWSFVLIALATSALLTYAASSMSVDRRLNELSLLRLAGMEARSVGRAVLSDSLVVAVGGTLLGALAAPFVSRTVLAVLALGASVRNEVTLAEPRPTSMTFGLGIAVGVVAVAAAAYPSARRAARVGPLELVDLGRGVARLNRTRRVAAVSVVLGLGLLVLSATDRAGPFGARVAAGLIGGVACAAAVGQRLIDRSTGPVEWLTRAVPRIGFLIGPSLRDRPIEAGLALAAWATIVAGLVTGITTIRSYTDSVDAYFYGLYGKSAVIVVAGDPLRAGGREALAAATVDMLRASPLVEEIAATRVVDVAYQGTRVPVFSFPAQAIASRGDLRYATRTPDQLRAALSNGEIAMNDTFANRFGVRVGDSIELPTSHGARVFRIGSVIRGGVGPTGALHMDEASFDRVFSAIEGENILVALWLAPPVAGSIRALQTIDTPQALFFLRGADARRLVGQSADRYRSLLAAPVGLTCGLGLVSLLSLLFSSTRARQREFLLLRAAGATPANLVTVIALSGGLIGTLGALIGAGLGRLWSVVTCDAVSAGLGWSVTPLFSTPLIAGVVAAAAVFAAVGSLVPALLYSTDRTTNSGTER